MPLTIDHAIDHADRYKYLWNVLETGENYLDWYNAHPDEPRPVLVTSKELDWHISYMKIAYEFAAHSTCIRKAVGAIIVRDGRIVSTGYNGTPKGLKHCCEAFKNIDFKELNTIGSPLNRKHGDFSRKYELHAEQNAIAFAAKAEIATNGATLYTTLSPCSDCAKLLLASGIKTVVYDEPYDRDFNGVNLVKDLGINVISLDCLVKDQLQL